jgi:hypothetical protein
MNPRMRTLRFVFVIVSVVLAPPVARSAEPPEYARKRSRADTVVALLQAGGVPTLAGKWYVAGPFDNAEGAGFDAAYPPERGVDLKASYAGKGGTKVTWTEFPSFRLGQLLNLARYDHNDDACVYLYHEFEAPGAVRLPVMFGSDDTLSVWLNGERLIHENYSRPAGADQDRVVLPIKAGRNQLLVKVCNGGGDWEVWICPDLPESWPAALQQKFRDDFPRALAAAAQTTRSQLAAEAVHYRLVTLPHPKDCVLEVGGLGLRPDGKLLACNRRGEIWLITDPGSADVSRIKYDLFASGLHEPLGMFVESDRVVYAVQRPELTRVVDSRGTGRADRFETVCEAWGVSGDYHEFAFGPARDRDGNFFVTLNVGFTGNHQSKAPWRGWAVRIGADGKLEPWAVGLRSPNGVNVSPDGEVFFTDNQGEWVASNKLHHLRRGEFYGHPAGLRWLKDSPFAGTFPDRPRSGMLYDGQKGKSGVAEMPPVTPPCIWFPYGRMGQSASEPRWDTTSGKFGPFPGQLFVGDQMKATVMRVALERVNGRYQGACFPFRSGFQCGVNRLVFGQDGKLYVGETARGWGSVGGKPYGLERLEYTGVLPFEIATIRLTKGGFDLTFTKPLDTASAAKAGAFAVQSYTYNYWSTYGSPEEDHRADAVKSVTLSADRRTVSFVVDGRRPGRVYEFRLTGVTAADGSPVLHPEGYYTLNELLP